MLLFASIAISAGLALLALSLWKRVPDWETPENVRWFRAWAIKGMAIPTLAWLLFNSGAFSRVPSFIMDIDLASSGSARFWLILNVAGLGALVVASFWVGITLGWLLTLIWRDMEERREFYTLAGVMSVALSPVIWGVVYFWGWGLAGVAATVWFLPIAHCMLPRLVKEKEQPNYNRAQVSMIRGKYDDAEEQVLEELEKCEDDFQGWMMLAELYALRFGDMELAHRTVIETCLQPNATAFQITGALNQLADWHLQVGEDPVRAREVLEAICKRWPGSHMDRMARLRINNLPANRAELLDRRRGKTFKIRKSVELETAVSDQHRYEHFSPEDAASCANGYVEKLRQNPNDPKAREELAHLLAEKLGKSEEALEQLGLLLLIPDQPAQDRARWLSMIATYQIRSRKPIDEIEATLRQLITEFPEMPEAFAAQKRLALMQMSDQLARSRALRQP